MGDRDAATGRDRPLRIFCRYESSFFYLGRFLPRRRQSNVLNFFCKGLIHSERSEPAPPQPAGETVRERENARTGLRERERERMPENQKWRNGITSEFSPFYGRRYRENTVIRYPYLPTPSFGTGSVLEASSTAPELPFNPIPGIGYWIPVIGRRYRQTPVPDDGPANPMCQREVTKAKENLLGLVRPLQKDICSFQGMS